MRRLGERGRVDGGQRGLGVRQIRGSVLEEGVDEVGEDVVTAVGGQLAQRIEALRLDGGLGGGADG